VDIEENEMKDRKPKIKALLNAAERELALFKNTREFPNLSQACEKIWVAFTLALEERANREIRGSVKIREIAFRLNYQYQYELTHKLHILHYEGSPDVEDSAVIQEVLEGIVQVRYMIS